MKKHLVPGWWMKNGVVKGCGRSIPFILICIFGGATEPVNDNGTLYGIN